MAFDGFTISYLIKELQAELLNAKLVKIISTDDSFFVLSFLKNKQKNDVVLSMKFPIVGFYKTNKSYINTNDSFFFKTLKKTLEQTILLSFKQIETDRIVVFEFQGFDFIKGLIKYELIFEIMGKHANLILTKDNIIIDAYKKNVSTNIRSIMPKLAFTHFLSNKQPFTNIDYQKCLTAEDLVSTYQGISKKLANYLIFNKIQINQIITAPVLYENGFYPFHVDHNLKIIQTSTLLSPLLDHFEDKKVVLPNIYQKFLTTSLKKEFTKLNKLENDLIKVQDTLILKDIADDIYLNYDRLQEVTTQYRFKNEVITFNDKKTLNEHAQDLYNKYHKAKRSIKPINQEIFKAHEKISYIKYHEDMLSSLDKNDLKDFELSLAAIGFKTKNNNKVKKQSRPSFHKIEIDYSTIYIGKNQVQNQALLTTIANKDDYWFHVKDYPGSHIILKTTNLTDDLINICAMLALYYSQAKTLLKTNVVYTKVKYVKHNNNLNGFNVIYKNESTHFTTLNTFIVENLLLRKD